MGGAGGAGDTGVGGGARVCDQEAAGQRVFHCVKGWMVIYM